MNWLTYVFKVIWLLGLFALVMIGYNLQMIVEQNSSENFNILPEIWFSFTVPALFGIYFSLLFIKKWSLKINVPLLLCVSLPCLVLSMYGPVVWTFVSTTTSSSSYSLPIPSWIFKINHLGIVSFVGGFSLFASLFSYTNSAGLRDTL